MGYYEFIDMITDAPYSALNSIQAGKTVIKQLRDVWEDSGLLDVLCYENKKDEMAVALANIGYIIENDEDRVDEIRENFFDFFEDDDMTFEELDGLLLAMMANVIREVDNFNTERFLNILSNIYIDTTKEEIIEIYEDMGVEDNDIDYNAELSIIITNTIIKEFNNTSDGDGLSALLMGENDSWEEDEEWEEDKWVN